MNSLDRDMSDVREEQIVVEQESMKSESNEPEEVKSIGPMYSQANPVIEISQIYFIFGDPQVKVNDCHLVIQILHPIIRGSIQSRSIHRQHPSILFISSLKKSFPMSNSSNQKFICWFLILEDFY